MKPIYLVVLGMLMGLYPIITIAEFNILFFWFIFLETMGLFLVIDYIIFYKKLND